MSKAEIINRLYESSGHGTRMQDIENIWDAAISYHETNKAEERLRDEFAMAVDAGELSEFTKEFRDAVMGKDDRSKSSDALEVLSYWDDFEMKLRYLKADAALKAREIK